MAGSASSETPESPTGASGSAPAQGSSPGPDLRVVLAVVLLIAVAAVFYTGMPAQRPAREPVDAPAEPLHIPEATTAANPTGASPEQPDPAEQPSQGERPAPAPAPETSEPAERSELFAPGIIRRGPGGSRRGEDAEVTTGEDEDEEEDEKPAKEDRPRKQPGPRFRRALIDMGPIPPSGMKLDGGRIVLFPKQRRIWLSGHICQDSVSIEYFAVFTGGKDHESVVVVHADPQNLNLALLAAQFKPGGGVRHVGDVAVPQGDPIQFLIEWKAAGGETRRVRAEKLVLERVTRREMQDIPWIFTGSRHIKPRDGGRLIFMAAVDGVMAAVYRDPNAIFNSPLPTGSDDEVYRINSQLCPPIGTPVKIILEPAPAGEFERLRARLLKEAKKAQQDGNETPLRPAAPDDAPTPDPAPAPKTAAPAGSGDAPPPP